MTETSASNSQRTRHAPGVIDGEAVVVARRQVIKSPRDRAAAAPIIPPAAEPDMPLSAHAAYVFERRQHPMPRAPLSVRRHPQADLLFQPQSPQRFAPPTRIDGVSLFLKDKSGAIPRNGRIAGLGALALSILIPAILFFSPQGPVSSAMAGVQAGGFRVAGLNAKIVPRGQGAVLSVEGTIHNATSRAGFAPPLRIALKSDGGIIQTRMLTTGAKSLAAGGALSFRSTVAVPAGARGAVSVDFINETRIDAIGPSPR